MHVMFVHQNFPAQFRYLAPRLVKEHGWQCTFVTERETGELPGVNKIIYKGKGLANKSNHICTRNFENTVRQAHGVYERLKEIKDLKPDLIVAHSGFGSSLFLPLLYDAPIINFFEYFYRHVGRDLGYRKELPVTEVQLLRSKAKNAMLLLDLDNCNRGWTPTHYQRDYFPKEYHAKIDVIFDGIDTAIYHRRENPDRQIGNDFRLPTEPRIVTYVARGFEMMRGFDIFMKIAKRIYQEYPNVLFVVVGGDRVHYGGDMNFIKEKTFREHVLKSEDFDLRKFVFTGFIPEETLAQILSISDLHLYLTEPFITSWSMVDAMACGAPVIASDQHCVREYIRDGENGFLKPFLDVDGFAAKAVEILKDPQAVAAVAKAGQEMVLRDYSVDAAIPKLKKYFEDVAANPRPVIERADVHVRVGTVPIVESPDEDETDGGSGNGLPQVGPSRDLPPLPDVTALSAVEATKTIFAHYRKHTMYPQEWVAAAASYRGKPGEFETASLPQHPTDMARLVKRVDEWKANTIVDVGQGSIGRIFLWAQAATDQAQIIVATVPGLSLSDERVEVLSSLARQKQKIICISGCADWTSLNQAIKRELGRREADFLFMDGKRSVNELRAAFKEYRGLIRKNGLFGFDGLSPVVSLGPELDGAAIFWKETQRLYPQNAEYLMGCSGMSGGIAMVKL